MPMDIETESFVSTREKSDDPVADRALRAEAMAFDMARLTFAHMAITRTMLVLLRRESPALVADLERELGLMAARMDNLVKALEGKSDG